jgi:anti-sigma factor (TIGR02949 family)
MGESCNCTECEQRLQPYVDRELTAAEVAEVETHLESCTYCRCCYEFEATLRRVVKRVLIEPMSAELKARLVALRTPLVSE